MTYRNNYGASCMDHESAARTHPVARASGTVPPRELQAANENSSKRELTRFHRCLTPRQLRGTTTSTSTWTSSRQRRASPTRITGSGGCSPHARTARCACLLTNEWFSKTDSDMQNGLREARILKSCRSYQKECRNFFLLYADLESLPVPCLLVKK